MNEQESGHNLGDIRVAQFVHPDSIGVTVWEVEQLKKAKGKYAQNGDVYWARITPLLSLLRAHTLLIGFWSLLKRATRLLG